MTTLVTVFWRDLLYDLAPEVKWLEMRSKKKDHYTSFYVTAVLLLPNKNNTIVQIFFVECMYLMKSFFEVHRS